MMKFKIWRIIGVKKPRKTHSFRHGGDTLIKANIFDKWTIEQISIRSKE